MFAFSLVAAGVLTFVGALVYQLHVRLTTGDQTQDYTPITPDISWPLLVAVSLIVAGMFVAIINA